MASAFDKQPSRPGLGPVGRALAAVAALLVALAFALPLWGVDISGPGGHLDVHAYVLGLAPGPATAADRLALLHQRLGLAAPPLGAYPGSLVLSCGLAATVVLALSAAVRGRQGGVFDALVFLGGSVAGELAVASLWLAHWGASITPGAAIAVPPFRPLLLGTSQAADTVATAGLQPGAALLALAGLLLVLALTWPRKESYA